jgi:DNA-binding transcriptional ArsR family regulator
MEDLSRYYTLLRDPARRKIIEILGTQEKIGFKELREALGLGVGTVYYHLDMLSDFITQDKQRKYRLNDRGQALYRVLKDGSIPPAMELGGVSTHGFAKWVFLSPIFAKTSRPLRFLPIAVAMLFVGAIGASYVQLTPALFFYSPYSTYSVAGIIVRYLLGWIGLFLFGEALAYLLYRRVGNSLQFLTCLCIATLPLMIYPYIYLAFPMLFAEVRFLDLDLAIKVILVLLQIWAVLLVSSAICFGKGLRLDKAVVISLTALYLNIAVLYLMGWFT